MTHQKILSDNNLTAFQKRVLVAVLDIPRGTVISYGELAKRIGSTSPRAVGQALSRNPYAPHVPCHRVIASDGSIGGYLRGIVRKKELLRREGIEVE